MNISLDSFFGFYPNKLLNPTTQLELDILNKFIPRVVFGFHQCAASLAVAGNNVIVDHVLQEKDWLMDCVARWKGLDVLFVGVKCPLEIVEQRERERGNREIGTARYQVDKVHAHGLYDLVIDTSILSIDQCVEKIINRSSQRTQVSVFEELSTILNV